MCQIAPMENQIKKFNKSSDIMKNNPYLSLNLSFSGALDKCLGSTCVPGAVVEIHCTKTLNDSAFLNEEKVGDTKSTPS